MPCTNPIKAWKYGSHPSGKQKLIFKDPKDPEIETQMVPCAKCESCRLDYARQWATRVTHEMQTSKLGCFLTLTIADEHMLKEGIWTKTGDYIPPYSVHRRTLQKFFKRLRKAIALDVPNPETGRTQKVYQKFRYLACGEYGTNRGRPHYHAAIMGYDFPDKIFWRKTPRGHYVHRSKLLEKLWPYGYAEVGELTYSSAAYIARYTTKKSKDPKDYEVATGYDPETGEILFETVEKEFLTMSKGIGLDWWLKYNPDTDKDYVIVDYDKTHPIPRYYDKQREKLKPDTLEEIKAKRQAAALEYQETDTYERKLARATVKSAQNKMLKRNLENGPKENLRTVR
jgi:hypothetical protein